MLQPLYVLYRAEMYEFNEPLKPCWVPQSVEQQRCTSGASDYCFVHSTLVKHATLLRVLYVPGTTYNSVEKNARRESYMAAEETISVVSYLVSYYYCCQCCIILATSVRSRDIILLLLPMLYYTCYVCTQQRYTSISSGRHWLEGPCLHTKVEHNVNQGCRGAILRVPPVRQ